MNKNMLKMRQMGSGVSKLAKEAEIAKSKGLRPSEFELSPRKSKSTKNTQNLRERIKSVKKGMKDEREVEGGRSAKKRLSYAQKINALGVKSKVKNLVLVASLVISLGYSGYYQAIPNIIGIPLTKKVYLLSRKDQVLRSGLFYSFLSLGSIFGNLSVSLLSRYLGRVRTFLVIEISKILVAL